jgi:hypothetical protein
LRVRLLPDPPKPLTPITDAEIRRLVLFKPLGWMQARTWTLILLLLDTGLRINEALGIDRSHVDLHNCLIRVLGKGNRERLVPISLECRKRLFLLLKGASRQDSPVFATRSGLRLTDCNARRDIKAVCKRLVSLARLSTLTRSATASRSPTFGAAVTSTDCRGCSGTPPSRPPNGICVRWALTPSMRVTSVCRRSARLLGVCDDGNRRPQQSLTTGVTVAAYAPGCDATTTTRTQRPYLALAKTCVMARKC